jgi:predicted O-linked N-acetylglucosamine transferase (SPINDLY family)
VKNSALLKPASQSDLEMFSSALAACQSALAAYNLAPADLARWRELQHGREALARAVADLPRKSWQPAALQPVLKLQRSLADSGIHDLATSGGDLDLAEGFFGQSPAGLVAAMLLAPAWRLSDAPAIDDVPVWLWGDYAAWLFFSPAAAPASAAKFAAHWLRHLQVLERWLQRNPGSAAVQAAHRAFLRAPLNPALFPAAGDFRRVAELRGRILTRALAKDRSAYEPSLMPRDGRRLRIGFLARHFAPGADLYATFPCLEHLDPKNFEVFLLTLEDSNPPETMSAVRAAKVCQVLSADWAERIEQIRLGRLDILVFAGDLGDVSGDLVRLGLHRLAGLQVVNQRKGLTTGLPEMDLYVTGASPATAEAGAGFTERLGLLRGPAHTFGFLRPANEAPEFLTRAQIGLPEGVTALATVVTPAGVSAATIAAWAEVLARAPGAHLHVVVVQDKAAGFVEDLCARIDAALARQGVEASRVTILPTWGGAAFEIRSVLACADVYLDATDAGTPVWLAEALAAGLPAVAFRCPHNPDLDAATGLLADARLPELIGADRGHYVRLAAELAGDPARREECRARLKSAMAAEPVFLDTLAAGDAFGALMLTAYDELASLGRAEFRRQREPLRCFGVEAVADSVEAGLAAHARGDIESAAFESALALRTAPADARVRHLHGLVLHAQGEHSRAVDYLVRAVQDEHASPAMWFALAKALRANRQVPQAIQALEICIRLDPKQVEVLLFLLDLAENAGATDIARDVLQLMQEVAPDDARVLAMS